MDKHGMELAVNTLVVLILGIIIVTGGIILMYNIFDKVQGIPGEVNRQTEEQLFSILLGTKQKIAVLDNVQTVKRGEQAIFSVAITNQLEAQESTFKVNPAPSLVVAPDGVTCNANPSCPVASALPGPYILPRYENKAFFVAVDVPKGAPGGEYSFNVEVLNGTGTNTDLYARAKVNVNVR